MPKFPLIFILSYHLLIQMKTLIYCLHFAQLLIRSKKIHFISSQSLKSIDRVKNLPDPFQLLSYILSAVVLSL